MVKATCLWQFFSYNNGFFVLTAMTMAMRREEETIPGIVPPPQTDTSIATTETLTATHHIGTATTVAIDTTSGGDIGEATVTTTSPPTAQPLVGQVSLQAACMQLSQLGLF